MPTPRLSLEQAEETIRRIEDQLRAGHRPAGMTGNGFGAVREAAEIAIADGFVSSSKTFEGRIEICKHRFGLEPDWSLYRQQRYQQPVPKSVLIPAEPLTAIAPGSGTRILVIGDLHQDPRHPDRLEVLTWISRYASEHKFERIIQVGDWSTWDSVNAHDRNDTV